MTRISAQSHANRRAHVISSATEVLVEHGVAGLTVRRVAEAAGVSTGSISYYFDEKDDLINAVFLNFIEASSHRFESFYEGVDSLDSARTATITMLVDTACDRASVVLATELYAISLHRPRFRLIADRWTKNCRAIMARYFDEDTVFHIDAFYEGLLLHKGMRLGEYSEERIAAAVTKLTPAHCFIYDSEGSKDK